MRFNKIKRQALVTTPCNATGLGQSSWKAAQMWHYRTWFSSRHGGDGLMVGLEDLSGLLQP